MAEVKPIPETEGLDAIVLGSFNPAIFHPEWFARFKLFAEEDVKSSKINVVSREVADIEICGIHLICIQERLSLGTTNISLAPRMQDVLLNILALLPHLPVSACGLNPHAHYRVKNVDHWHKIGHTLAPKEPIWNGLVKKPGMRSLTIEGQREGEFGGQTHLSVEPSLLVTPGIFTRANYHFQLPADKVHDGSVELISAFIKAEWDKANQTARRIAETIFEKILPDHG